MFRQVESESEGDYEDDYQYDEDGGTEDEAERSRVEELKEIATQYEFHHLEEYVTHLQVAFGHPEPFVHMDIGETQDTFLQICTGAGLHIETVLAGLENVKQNDQKWRGDFAKVKDMNNERENLIQAKILRCKREKILPELINGFQRPEGMPYDEYLNKADKERLAQLEAELWDMYYRGVSDPSSSNIATRKKAFFRYKFFQETLKETDTLSLSP